MAIQDLQARQGKVDIAVEIVDKGEIREFEKFGKRGRVCSATAKDTTGEIKLSLWNEQIDQVNVGDVVKITNGYVSEFQGEKQLTTGKFGQLEVLEKGSSTSVESGTKQETIQAAAEEEKEEEETETPVTEDEEQESEELSEPESDEGEKVVTEDEKTEEEVLDESPEVPVSPEATATEDEIVESAEEPVEEEKI